MREAWRRHTRRNAAWLAASIAAAAVIAELAVRILLDEAVLAAIGIGP